MLAMLCRLPLPARQPPSPFQRACVANRTDTGMPPLVAQERRCVSEWQPSSIIAATYHRYVTAAFWLTPSKHRSAADNFAPFLMLRVRKCDTWQAVMFLSLGLFMPDCLLVLFGRHSVLE